MNLIKTSDGWKIWTMTTLIEGLLDYPELPGPKGGQSAVENWQEARDRELAFEDKQPDVVIVGGGHW